ncbi:MDR family MFS transporter [Deinococcus budaensis]|uniref:EmrB/QacA subfamily drug resistance transporter n=1 Tax=Deinococcus budaensis TaxID=1665626 RepID=A0A7W8GCL4_9DEIO|nr:MDR family MFS transporter [Deinococcus budaensis]MBB5232979.1 EmrB/QacA subfamily drug resistance transporter [Deinococcus budaensis]
MTTPPSAPPGRINYAQTLDLRTKRVILFGVLLGLFLSALDQTIVATAMPRIAEELDGLNLYTWVTTAYLLTNTALVPIYGKLSDLYGRKPVLMFGIVVFLIGSALCGLAGEPFFGNLFGGGMMQLVVFRGLQGVGAAALGSVAFAIIADLFEPIDRPRYQGLFGAVFGISSVAGPLLGGFLTDQISWRWVFYVNLPLGLIALAFISAKMPRLASGLQARVDWLGAFLILVFTVPLLLALTWGANQTYAWTSPTLLGLFGLSAAALVAFLWVEGRHPSPILPLTLFSNPTFAWGAVARFLIGAGFLGAILFLSLYLVNVQGVSATAAGTATIPLTVGLIIGSVGSGQIASRIGRYKVLMLIGLMTAALGFFALSTLNADTAYGGVVLRMVLLGLGLGPALPLYTTALQLSVKPWEIGVATSAGQFFQQMGSTIGTAIFGALLTAGLASQFTANFERAKVDQPPAVQAILTQSERAAAANTGGGFGEGAPAGGGDPAAQFAQARREIEAAVASGNSAALGQIAQNPALPAGLREGLGRIPAQALATPEGRAGVAQTLAGQFRAFEIAGQKTARVVKESFAGAIANIYRWSIGVALLALLATLMMPNLALPTRQKGERGAPAHVEL